MIVQWITDDLVLADRESVAEWYQVSQRTVRRYCPVAGRDLATGRALHDVFAAAEQLAGVIARPDTTLAAVRARLARTRRTDPRRTRDRAC